MDRFTKSAVRGEIDGASTLRVGDIVGKGLLVASLLVVIALLGCGTEAHNNAAPLPPLTLSGNWQFTTAPPGDGSFIGGIQGGFLLQTKGSATGSLAYSISLPNGLSPCNSGSATVTGTINGQNVSLIAVAGTQTFTFTGTLSLTSSTMVGTYSSTSGTAADGSPCGTAQSGLQWTATLVPPLTGSIQGSFFSGGGPAGLSEQVFAVSGGVSQATNTGGSSASVKGTLNFINQVTNQSDYPCIAAASVNGQISGSTVSLQIVANDGSTIGQIGTTASDPSNLGLVSLMPVQDTYVLQGISGFAYAVYASACGGGTLADPADFGNICLALNTTTASVTACAVPFTLTPPVVSFTAQVVGTSSTQAITLTNVSKSTLGGLVLTLTNQSGSNIFSETDNCNGGAASNGQPFVLSASQSCVVQVTYSPQCAASCPSSQKATLALNSPNNSMIFTVPISGTPQAGSSSAGAFRSGARLRVEPDNEFTSDNGLVSQSGALARTYSY